MSYIGKTPTVGNFQVCDAISVVNGQAAYTMQVDSVNVVPESANHMLVSLNGILQKPGGSFTVSGSTITFASNLATGDVIDFITLLGNVLDLGTPSDATVTNAKTNFVSTSSAAGLQIKGDGTTDGTLQLNCSQNSHGIKLKSPAHSASASYTLTFPTTDGNADQFLQSNGSGVLTWADAGGGYTQSSVLTPTGSYIEFTGIPSGTNSIVIKAYGLQWAGSPSNIGLVLGDSGGYETSGYHSIDFYRGVSAGDMGANTKTSEFMIAYGYSGSDYWNGNLFLNHVGGNRWVQNYCINDVSEYIRIGAGQKILSGELTKLKIINQGGENSDGGNIQIMYQ